MQVHVFQHVSFEGLGALEPLLLRRGADISVTKFHEGELPPATFPDMLVVMGGPMSVNDLEAFPWLVQEKRYIRSCCEKGLPVLGVCLGAQLIASAFGARVYRNELKEIGWFSIRGLGTVGDTFQFPSEAIVFHWHGETFDLPPGALPLASSEACKNQAFQLGRKTVGLQFHLETNSSAAEAMLANGAEELVTGTWIQDAATIRQKTARHEAGTEGLLRRLVDFMLR